MKLKSSPTPERLQLLKQIEREYRQEQRIKRIRAQIAKEVLKELGLWYLFRPKA